MFKPKLSQQEQGFTLVEVLVAILITTLFVAVSMQAMVLAAVFKTRAQESAEATTWIQEDLENVKYQASRYKDETECAPTIINDGYADGFRDSLIKLDDLTKTKKIGNQTGYYSEYFDKNIRTKKKFRLTRTTNPVDNSPYNRLEVSYDVSPTSGGSTLSSSATLGTSSINVAVVDNFAVNNNLRVGSAPSTYRISAINGKTLTITPNLRTAQPQGSTVVATIANFYTEVIPDAAFQCP